MKESIDSKEDSPMFTITSEDGRFQVAVIEVIGQGGCGIAYKGILNPEDKPEYPQRVCVVKAYFPIEVNLEKGIRYVLDENGNIKIEAKNESLRDQELERQDMHVNYEIEMSQRLFLNINEGKVNNNPHFYQAWRFNRLGDSTYILLDTADGETLQALLEKEKQMDIRDALDYVKTLIQIIKRYFNGEKLYIHGDLKPENIWITDAHNGCARGMVILDFGSVFALEDYQMPLEGASESAIMRQADKIVANEGLGCSSEGYISGRLLDLVEAKSWYLNVRNYKKAKHLIETVNKIDHTVDIYSIVQIFYYLVTGQKYVSDGTVRIDTIGEATGQEQAVCKWILSVMSKNSSSAYQSFEDVETDIEVLEDLLNRNANPYVLLEELKKKSTMFSGIGIDEKLMADVKIINHQ